MTKHEEKCLSWLKNLYKRRKETPWYWLRSHFYIWYDMRAYKQSIRTVRKMNGNYDRKIEVTKQ